MQTLTVNIQDNFIQDFLTVIDHYKDKIQLQKDIYDIDNGKVKMINNEDFWDEIDSFTESLQK